MAVIRVGRELKKVTIKQEDVNAELRRLHELHKDRIAQLTSAQQIRDWAIEIEHPDVSWFFGELLMMVHPAFINIGPDLYNHLLTFAGEFERRESWFGNHLKLDPDKKEQTE